MAASGALLCLHLVDWIQYCIRIDHYRRERIACLVFGSVSMLCGFTPHAKFAAAAMPTSGQDHGGKFAAQSPELARRANRSTDKPRLLVFAARLLELADRVDCLLRRAATAHLMPADWPWPAPTSNSAAPVAVPSAVFVTPKTAASYSSR